VQPRRCARRSPEHGLAARIGVNTGEVVVGGDSETLVTGDAVNVAARLEQAAASGEALIGARARLYLAVVLARAGKGAESAQRAADGLAVLEAKGDQTGRTWALEVLKRGVTS
jgi:class 3 adenylate cyclase